MRILVTELGEHETNLPAWTLQRRTRCIVCGSGSLGSDRRSCLWQIQPCSWMNQRDFFFLSRHFRNWHYMRADSGSFRRDAKCFSSNNGIYQRSAAQESGNKTNDSALAIEDFTDWEPTAAPSGILAEIFTYCVRNIKRLTQRYWGPWTQRRNMCLFHQILQTDAAHYQRTQKGVG